MKLRNLRILIIAILIVVIIIALSIWLYVDIKENKRIDAEAITLTEDLTVEFGEKVKVSDFIKNINGELLNDYEINTEHLGEIKVHFEYLNIKNRKRKYEFTINIIDATPPKILIGSSYTLKVRK